MTSQVPHPALEKQHQALTCWGQFNPCWCSGMLPFPLKLFKKKVTCCHKQSCSGTSCNCELAEASIHFIMQLSIIRHSLLFYHLGTSTHLCRAMGDWQRSETEPCLFSVTWHLTPTAPLFTCSEVASTLRQVQMHQGPPFQWCKGHSPCVFVRLQDSLVVDGQYGVHREGRGNCGFILSERKTVAIYNKLP